MWPEQFECETIKLKHSNPEDFSICNWQKGDGVGPAWLTYRILIFLYFFASLVTLIIFWATDDIRVSDEIGFVVKMSDSMHITQFLVFLFGLVVIALDYSKERGASGPSENVMTVLQNTYWCVYTAALPCSVAVCITFWSAVYEKHQEITAVAIILRIIDSVIHVIDFFLVAFPHRFYHIYMPEFLALIHVIAFTIADEIKTPSVIDPLFNWRAHTYKTFFFVIIFLVGIYIIHIIFFLFYMMKLKFRKKGGGGDE